MKQNNEAIEKYRVWQGPLASTELNGNNGAFVTPMGGCKVYVMASDGDGWDHVSVSLKQRCPNWREMCMIKDLFFTEDECVIQYHPAKKDYINCHNFCLHMWKPQGIELPMPPVRMI